MAEARITSAGQYVEIDGQLVHITSVGAYTELQAPLIHITSAGAYTEIVRAQARITALGAYVEIAPCAPGSSAHYTWDGVDITNYVNELDLQVAGKELEATHFGSTAEEADSGLSSHSLRLAGDWNQTIDDLLGQAALSGRRVTGMASFEACAFATRYTWTDTAYLTNWRVAVVAKGKAVWSATLRHVGAPTRAVIEL